MSLIQYISGQLGTAQLGLAQLGQFEAPQVGFTIDGNTTTVLEATATPFHTGAALSGGAPPLVIRGAGKGPQRATATAFSGGVLITPGLAGGKARGRGLWPWAPSLLELGLLTDALPDADTRELLQDVGEMFGRGSAEERNG